MAKQSIDLGTTPNDGTGSNLRVGGDIINDNFNEVYTTLGDGSDLAFDITGVSNGQTLVYNSSTSKFEAGTAAGGSFTLRDSSSTTQLISDSDILNVVGSGGITATVSATDTLTIAAGSSIATLTGSQVLTNKTLTSPVLNTGVSGTAILDEDTMSSNSDTQLATQQSIKAYVDNEISGLSSTLTIRDDSSTTDNVTIGTDTLSFAGGTGITSVVSDNTVTFNIDSTVATLTGSQVLTNKTLTSAVLNTGVSGTAILDEDTMSSNSDTQLATQQSIKAYVDANAGGGISWQTGVVADGSTVTAAAAGEGYFIDTTSATHTLQLPSSPTIGDEISIIDVAGTFDTNILTVDRNGKPIQGSASDLTVSVERAGFTLVFYDNTQGWVLKDK